MFFSPSFVRLTLPCLMAISAALPAAAQSLDVKTPTPLHAGANKATIDSFGGDHFWTFTAQPGNFTIRFGAGSPQEGFSVGGKANIGAVFAPTTPGAVMKFAESPQGTTVTGHVTAPTKVIMMVEAKKSPLVRQTTDYYIEAAGSASFGAGGGAAAHGPTVVGIYADGLTGQGSAKFTADGSILTTGGTHGHWELFDADSRTYVVVMGGVRNSLTFQPGRGFVANNGNLVLEMKHQ